MSARHQYSRQKSYDTCVRGKRRCGQESPSCARCSKMGLSCTYQTHPSGISRNDDHHTPQSSNVIQESETPASDFLSPEIPILLDPTNELVISNLDSRSRISSMTSPPTHYPRAGSISAYSNSKANPKCCYAAIETPSSTPSSTTTSCPSHRLSKKLTVHSPYTSPRQRQHLPLYSA
jgi:hypothetical protein